MGHSEQFEYEEKRSFMKRFGFAIGGLSIVAVGVVMLAQVFSGHTGAPPAKMPDMVMIKTAPLPPPPPPPPPQQVVQKQEMMEQTPDDSAKPVEQPDPAPVLGTNIQSNGPADGFGLSGHANGFLQGSGGSGKSGSRFGWYANEVDQQLADALRQNPRTRDASFSVKARIWSDLAGRIIRAKLSGSSGDTFIDKVIRDEVLMGFQLRDPPPEGMPMPIVMRLSARRPN
jgi:periplasmic protein TonB